MGSDSTVSSRVLEQGGGRLDVSWPVQPCEGQQPGGIWEQGVTPDTEHRGQIMDLMVISSTLACFHSSPPSLGPFLMMIREGLNDTAPLWGGETWQMGGDKETFSARRTDDLNENVVCVLDASFISGEVCVNSIRSRHAHIIIGRFIFSQDAISRFSLPVSSPDEIIRDLKSFQRFMLLKCYIDLSMHVFLCNCTK